MNLAQVHMLARRLRQLEEPIQRGVMREDQAAAAIIANPQAHIDALVDAGVLVSNVGWAVRDERGSRTGVLYALAAPHEHRWCWDMHNPGRIRCADPDCTEGRQVDDLSNYGPNWTNVPKTCWPLFDGEVPA